MIDHSEGILRLRKALAALEQAMLKKQYTTAMALCAEIETDARLVAHQIFIEEGADAARHPSAS